MSPPKALLKSSPPQLPPRIAPLLSGVQGHTRTPPTSAAPPPPGLTPPCVSPVALQIGLEQGCTQMKLAVLDWNRTAIGFYLGQGAADLTATEGWHFFRFEADAMRRLARGDPGK